jgi:hypothetical protein
MAALVLDGALMRGWRASRGLGQYERSLKRLGGLNGLPRLRGLAHVASGRCFLRITSSRAGQIQGTGLQVVAARVGGSVEGEGERDHGVGFGVVKSVAKSVLEAVCSVQKPAMVALLFCLLVSQGPEMAAAASGGRVGGSSFRSYYPYSL